LNFTQLRLFFFASVRGNLNIWPGNIRQAVFRGNSKDRFFYLKSVNLKAPAIWRNLHIYWQDSL